MSSFYKILAVNSHDVFIFFYVEILHKEAVRVIVRTGCIKKLTSSNQLAFRLVTFPDDDQPGISSYLIWLYIVITSYTVHNYVLNDIARNYAVIIPLLRHIFIVIESGLIAKHHCPSDIVLYRILIRR